MIKKVRYLKNKCLHYSYCKGVYPKSIVPVDFRRLVLYSEDSVLCSTLYMIKSTQGMVLCLKSLHVGFEELNVPFSSTEKHINFLNIFPKKARVKMCLLFSIIIKNDFLTVIRYFHDRHKDKRRKKNWDRLYLTLKLTSCYLTYTNIKNLL